MKRFEEKEYSLRFDAALWKKLILYAWEYKPYLISLAGVMVLVAVIDAVFPLFTRWAIDGFIVPRTLEGIEKFILLFFALIALQAGNVWLLIALAGKIETGISYDIRHRGFKRLQELSFSYYDTTPVGWIMARMTGDTQKLGETISWGLVDLAWGGTMMIAIAVFMLIMNWKLALIALLVVPPLVLVSGFFQKRILTSQREVRKTNSRISGSFNEGITGAKTTKTLVREEANLSEFTQLTTIMRRASVRTAVFTALYLPLVLVLGSIGTSLALFFGGRGIALEAVSYGTLIAFLSYTVQFFEPVREVARVFAELQAAQASAERVLSMIETPPDITDQPDIVERYGDVFSPKREAWPPVKGEVTFRKVSFRYKNGEKVLHNFNLHVDAGETVALIGETGSGKSTIVNLACRFYEPTSGRVLIDGVDCQERSILWHYSNLGYVLQSPHLFSGTVRENILYGNLNAAEEEILGAAKMAGVDSFLSRLPKGYDSEVGEGGNLLSTGEKQLVSFARAILANPPIFVFDEATSSIDTETEALIQRAITAVLKNRTSFIVAHRLSTIREADRILLIHKGKIVEEGNHASLLKLKGGYYRLYTNQFAAGNTEVPAK